MPEADSPPTATVSLPSIESLMERLLHILFDDCSGPTPTVDPRAVPHITFGLVARSFEAVEQVKQANDMRLKQLKQPVVNREKAVACLLYDLIRMDFPDAPETASKAGKRLRDQLNTVEREIKSLRDACARAVMQAAPMDCPALNAKLEADIAELMRGKCTGLDEPSPRPPPPPPALMPPSPEPSSLTHVPELDDPRSPAVPAHLATIYKELGEAREDLEQGYPGAAPYLWKLAKQIDKRERLSELEVENECLKIQNASLNKQLAAANGQLEARRQEEAEEAERIDLEREQSKRTLAEASRILQAAQAVHAAAHVFATPALPAEVCGLLAERPTGEPLAEADGTGLESAATCSHVPEEEALHRHMPGLVRLARHPLNSLPELTAEEAAFKAGCMSSLQGFDSLLHDYLMLPSHARAQWQYLQPNRPTYRVFEDRERGMRQVFGLHR